MEDFFRFALIAGFAIVIPFAVYYRARAHTQNEKMQRLTNEGAFIFFGLRICAAITFASLIAYLIDPNSVSWAAFPLPFWVRASGLVFGALGGLLWIYTFQHLGKNLTDTVHVRKEATLVMSGPYAHVRHPFYVAFFMVVIGNAVAAANWLLLASGLLAITFIYLRTATEEKKLIERFGDAYRTYMQRVGRFVPKLLR